MRENVTACECPTTTKVPARTFRDRFGRVNATRIPSHLHCSFWPHNDVFSKTFCADTKDMQLTLSPLIGLNVSHLVFCDLMSDRLLDINCCSTSVWYREWIFKWLYSLSNWPVVIVWAPQLVSLLARLAQQPEASYQSDFCLSHSADSAHSDQCPAFQWRWLPPNGFSVNHLFSFFFSIPL